MWWREFEFELMDRETKEKGMVKITLTLEDIRYFYEYPDGETKLLNRTQIVLMDGRVLNIQCPYRQFKKIHDELIEAQNTQWDMEDNEESEDIQ